MFKEMILQSSKVQIKDDTYSALNVLTALGNGRGVGYNSIHVSRHVGKSVSSSMVSRFTGTT